jgi:ribosomal-protein-alanine N-acetyltransferase
MVARPPLRVRVEAMRSDDIPAVHEIERASFTAPWPTYAFRQELESNRLARYVVARDGEAVIGYAGLWLMVDEAHITTFAVAPDYRRQGVGEALLQEMLRIAESVGAGVATLEVRVSNLPARRLYEKYGFVPVGVRPRYYTDNNEDALIMTTGELRSREMRARLSRLADELRRRAGEIAPGGESTA